MFRGDVCGAWERRGPVRLSWVPVRPRGEWRAGEIGLDCTRAAGVNCSGFWRGTGASLSGRRSDESFQGEQSTEVAWAGAKARPESRRKEDQKIDPARDLWTIATLVLGCPRVLGNRLVLGPKAAQVPGCPTCRGNALHKAADPIRLDAPGGQGLQLCAGSPLPLLPVALSSAGGRSGRSGEY